MEIPIWEKLYCSKCRTKHVHYLNNDLTGDEYYCIFCKTTRPLDERAAIVEVVQPILDHFNNRVKVRFTNDFENFPHLIIDKGMTGHVASVDDEIIYVQMDDEFKGYDAAMWQGEGWKPREVHIHVEALEFEPGILERV